MTVNLLDARAWRLLDLLADGEFHSGETLAGQLGVSRSTVFNALAEVSACAVALQRVRGRGYRLARPWQRLERDEILRELGKQAAKFDLSILPQAASSNTVLLQRAATMGAASGSVLAVELQTGGRGRMGNAWHSGLGSTLTFSLLWRFSCGLNALSGLSLALGVAQLRALNKMGAQGLGLKWPNDILAPQGKLGGVLIEAQGDMLGPSAVVIGIGMNCSLPAELVRRIDQAASALDEVCPNLPTRSQILAGLLLELADVLQQFERGGFAVLRDEWEQYHVYQNRPISLHTTDKIVVSGIARGVSDTGALCLETKQGLQYFNAGEVRGR